MGVQEGGLTRNLPVLGAAARPRLRLPEIVRSLIEAPMEAVSAAVRLPGLLPRLVDEAQRAADLAERLEGLGGRLIERLDGFVGRTDILAQRAREVTDGIPAAVGELGATREALEGAREDLQGLAIQIEKFETLAERIADMEVNIARMTEHMATVIRLTQPLEGAQEAAQRFRDSLRFGSRRRKGSEEGGGD